MWFVSSVDDRAGSSRRTGNTLPNVIGTLTHGVSRTPRCLHDLASTNQDLPADEKRNKSLRQGREISLSLDQKIFVTTVGISRRISVVFEQINVTVNSLLNQSFFRLNTEPFKDSFASTILGKQLKEVITFCGGVLGMRTNIKIEPGAICQKNIAAATPTHDTAEQVSSNFIWAKPPLTFKSAGDAVFRFNAENSAIHPIPAALSQ